jgi:hypothetical protein
LELHRGDVAVAVPQENKSAAQKHFTLAQPSEFRVTRSSTGPSNQASLAKAPAGSVAQRTTGGGVTAKRGLIRGDGRRVACGGGKALAGREQESGGRSSRGARCVAGEVDGLSGPGVASKEAVGSSEELAVWKTKGLGGKLAYRGKAGRPSAGGRIGLKMNKSRSNLLGVSRPGQLLGGRDAEDGQGSDRHQRHQEPLDCRALGPDCIGLRRALDGLSHGPSYFGVCSDETFGSGLYTC